MLETKVIVAPNSPSARAKHNNRPATMPGKASGSVTVKNTKAGLAPSVAAASSSRRSNQKRKSHHAGRKRRAGPAERENHAKVIVKERADRALAAEPDQQQVTGHDRW